MEMEHVILVDKEDKAIGTMEKLEAHRKGVLHRAFSVLLFDNSGKLLLQKRSARKYHSSRLWTNTCCSHPLPGESLETATLRRLKEEMGIVVQPTFAFSFIYKAPLDHELTEHELDHVFIGTYNDAPFTPPTLAGDPQAIAESIRPGDEPLEFTVASAENEPLRLIPYHRIAHERYATYWKLQPGTF